MQIRKNENSKSVDLKFYGGMIGSLLYLTASRLDIMFSIYMCVKFQSDPKESYLNTVKKNLKIFKKYSNFRLMIF